MFTLSPLSGSGVRMTGAEKALSIFPAKQRPDDINLISAPEESMTEGVVSWPGEYDMAGITIRGIGHSDGQQVSYLVENDGIRCAFPSTPLQEWKDEDIERLGDVHILVLPAENPKACQKLLEDVDPRMLVIIPGGNGKMDHEVIKACGAAGKEVVSEAKIKGSFAAEGREVLVFGGK